jgi:hypothetical protein
VPQHDLIDGHVARLESTDAGRRLDADGRLASEAPLRVRGAAGAPQPRPPNTTTELTPQQRRAREAWRGTGERELRRFRF